MVGLEINDSQVQRTFRSIERSASGGLRGDFQRRFFTRLGAMVLGWIDENFASGGQLVGGWAPLRPLTLFGRRGGSSTPLTNTGALRQSFTAQPSDTGLVVGTTSSIAPYHNYGTRPYDIYPRNAKALAFPAPPRGGVPGYVRRRPYGTPRIGTTTTRAVQAAGMTVPGGRGDLQSFAFSKHVHHPGLPARRMLPTNDELKPLIAQAAREVFSERR